MSTNVLIVEDDPQLRDTLVRDLRGHGMSVFEASNYDEAIDQLGQNTIDVLVTDLRLGDRDGIDILESLREHSPSTTPVLMSAYATARDHNVATSLGAVCVLTKPFTRQALLEAIERAVECREGFRGSVHGLSLIDMLQMFHFAKRSITLYVAGRRPGRLVIKSGEVVHAQMGRREGLEALQGLLQSNSGSLRSASYVEVEPNIDMSFDSLLLEVVRQLDERAHTGELLPVSDDDDDDMDFDFFPTSPKESEAVKPAVLEPEPAADPEPMAPLAPPSAPVEAAQDTTISPAEPLEASPPQPRPQGEPPTTPQTTTPRRREMGKIDDACRRLVGAVDGGIACGVVDLDSGMILGIYNSASYTQTLNEIVAAATMDLFRGPNIGRIEQMVRSHRGVPENGESYFQEVHVSSKHNYHFIKTVKDGRAAVVLVTQKTTSLGMGWAQLKSEIRQIEPHVP